MGLQTAKEIFQRAGESSNQPEFHQLVDGLMELTRVIESELATIRSEIKRLSDW
jgi:hypothetical protein